MRSGPRGGNDIAPVNVFGMRAALLVVLVVVGVMSGSCASRPKQSVDPTVLVAPPYDSTKHDPPGVIFRNVFTPGDSAFGVFQVEKPVAASPANQPPASPPELRRTKPQGEVIAQFVVDTTGRADMKTFKVLRSSDDLFSESVRRALIRYQFFPAEVGGRKVRQRVEMPFIFNVMSPN